MSVDARSPSNMRPSTLHLPRGNWATVYECLCAHFPAIAPAVWQERIARGRVLDAQGLPIGMAAAYREGLKVHYFREVPAETPIPFEETLLHVDEHLLVADKPHFLPVMPAGEYVEQTLQARLAKRLGNADLVPLHRIDRHTAGLVLFSTNRQSRGQYQALFRLRQMDKCYEALAPALPQLEFPLLRATRLEGGEPFFRMQEVAGEANSETRIEVAQRLGEHWLYRLYPVTGKKHQLRVHLAALGAPGTVGVGYNSIRFDDEVTRYTLYRNFYDPYAYSWQNGNSRWDILDMLRACYALRPEGIEWAFDEEGKPSFRLEKLTVANGVAHANAHDALSDVLATIEMAKLVKKAQPKLFGYLFELRNKNKVKALIAA